MTTRILPPAEYAKLKGTEAEMIVPQLTDATRVVVVEQDGQVIGCHLLQTVLHAECLWVHPDHRGKASVARRLWSRVRSEVREHYGVPGFLTMAVSPQVRQLLAHLDATHVVGETYFVPVGER